MSKEIFNSELNEIDSDQRLVSFCRKNFLHGIPYVFQDRENDFFHFREKIANQFDINYYEIFIVGSAKLGFSPYRNTDFDDNSDIDIAIISDILFNKIMDLISIFQFQVRKGRIGSNAISKREIVEYHSFLEYIALGWIRPDKLPTSLQLTKEFKDGWFDFFHSISHGKSEVGNYKVNAGVYKSHKHLENYLLEGLRNMRNISKQV